jgi:glucose/arabinose dehydrogenase
VRKHERWTSLLAAALTATACGDDAANAARDRAPGDVTANAPGSGGFVPAAREQPRLLEVIAGVYDFNPSELVAEPGEYLMVSLRNLDSAAHAIEFDLQGKRFLLDEPIPPGQSAALQFIVPVQPGIYDFRCPTHDNDEHWMRGRLLVMGAPAVRLQEVAAGLTLPIALAVPPGGADGRRFVVDQIGVVRVLTGDDRLLATPFVDLRTRIVALDPNGDARGLLGLAFHPRFAQNGRLFVSYTGPLRAGAPPGFDHTSYVSELRVSSERPNAVEPASERIVLAIDRPHAEHAAGTIAFGPHDGMLYVAVGAGGEPRSRAQQGERWSGTLLRIDVDASEGERGYRIPADNPFAAVAGAQEIFASGFNAPGSFSFDAAGEHALMVPDTGAGSWEEVNRVHAGGDYGWSSREGTHCLSADGAPQPDSRCADGGSDRELQWPVIELANAAQAGGMGERIVGGYVYRGSAVPALYGHYVFGAHDRDASAKRSLLLSASDLGPSRDDLWPVRRVAIQGEGQYYVEHILHGIGQDEHGELYLLVAAERGPVGRTGRVLRVEAPGR